MYKEVVVLMVLMVLLVGCQANQSAFSPDMTTTIEPSSVDPVNISENDLSVTVTNDGQINAYDVTISIEVNEQSVEETIVEEMSTGEEKTILLTKEDLTEFCSDQENTVKASAAPNVKDLTPENNDASQRITC